MIKIINWFLGISGVLLVVLASAWLSKTWIVCHLVQMPLNGFCLGEVGLFDTSNGPGPWTIVGLVVVIWLAARVNREPRP